MNKVWFDRNAPFLYENGVKSLTSPSMSGRDFHRISKSIHRMSGIVLQDHKQAMVQARILDRVKYLGFESFSDYLDFLEQSAGHGELEVFCNALTTNLTSFFREFHHFEHFSAEVERLGLSGAEKLRIWSAGCSSGEEAYSIAALLMDKSMLSLVADTKILATDIDTKVLRTAKMASYPASSIDQLSGLNSNRVIEVNGADFVFTSEIRKLIQFKTLNLLQRWPMAGLFDVIFCRNVLIYFSAETKEKLIQRFAKMLRPRGVLYLGHSEIILGDHPLLISEGATIYRRSPL